MDIGSKGYAILGGGEIHTRGFMILLGVLVLCIPFEDALSSSRWKRWVVVVLEVQCSMVTGVGTLDGLWFLGYL